LASFVPTRQAFALPPIPDAIACAIFSVFPQVESKTTNAFIVPPASFIHCDRRVRKDDDAGSGTEKDLRLQYH
jgi:hypothetical protein